MKKRQVYKLFVPRKKLLRFMLIMKLTVLFLTVACVQVYATGFSQDKISLTLKNVALKKALISIKKNSQYRFIYNDDILPKNRKVSLEVKDATIQEVLNLIFLSTTLTYRILENKLVVISQKEEISDQIPGTEFLQDGVIRGKIINEKGEPIPGATVTLENTNRVVAASDKGEFIIEGVESGKYKLKITAVGYHEIIQEINVTSGIRDIAVTLTETKAELSEVVVTALGIQRQARTLTYATQKVAGDKLNEVRSANIANSLSGKVAGMVVTSNAYGPGSSAKILLRGNRSIAADNGALIVVDGAIVDNSTGYTRYGYNSNTNSGSDGISGINPDDVESINVLKGSAATALYGTTGSNGVVLITTKKGKS
ncbi:MAG: carboxypeptidase-like regulatory domain-containing protein, partial [Ginsengibacter sp.]